MVRTPIPDYNRYEEESWESWENTLYAHKYGTSLVDKVNFLPSPLEIRKRCKMLRWLQKKGFDDNRFLCAIMQHEHPGIKLVRKLVRKHGPKEARRRLTPFLPPTEYDNE